MPTKVSNEVPTHVRKVLELLRSRLGALDRATIERLVPFPTYIALRRYTEELWQQLEPAKRAILNELINGRYLDIDVPQLRDLTNAVSFDRFYNMGMDEPRPVFLLIIPDVLDLLRKADNVHHFMHLLYRRRVGLSPYDLLKIIVEGNNNTLDYLWEKVRDRIDEETFKRLVLYLHYALGGTFSEAIGPGWMLPGIIRAYAISVPKMEEYIKLAHVE